MTTYILVALAALLLLFVARKPRSVDDRQGQQFNPPKDDQASLSDQPAQALVVATYNVQTGKNLQGQRDITRAAEILKNVDIAGVQEVYAPSWSNIVGLGKSQTEILANQGRFFWLFCPTRFRWFRENRGNAILSKRPILSWHTTMLPDQTGISFRNMTVASFEWQGQSCYFINTHLHTSIGNAEQLQAVLKAFDNYSPAILVGDFNRTPGSELLADTLRSSNATDAIAHSHIDQNDSERIDWIITKGWKIISGRKIEKGISDHPYYEISLELL